jgi:hypothetical protein
VPGRSSKGYSREPTYQEETGGRAHPVGWGPKAKSSHRWRSGKGIPERRKDLGKGIETGKCRVPCAQTQKFCGVERVGLSRRQEERLNSEALESESVFCTHSFSK